MTGCEKKRYPSRIAAQMALVDIWTGSKSRTRRQEGRAYFCKPCRAWHLTSQPKQRAS